jgi:hypothetical protein
LLQQTEFSVEYDDQHELLARSCVAKQNFHRGRAGLETWVAWELASDNWPLGAVALAASSGREEGATLGEGLAALRRLESIPAVLRKISYVAREGKRFAFEDLLADSGASCSVLDEGSARQLVLAGVAEMFPLESGDLTAIHGVGGQRHTSGVCIAKLACWCADSHAWVKFQLLAFVLEGSERLRIIGNTFLRHHRAVIDVGAGRVGLDFGERGVRTPITTKRSETCEQWANVVRAGGGAVLRRGRVGLAMDSLAARSASHAAALQADEAPLVFCKRELRCLPFGDTVIECDIPFIGDGTDLHVSPLAKGSTAFSWFTSTPLVVHAGNHTVREGKIQLWVRNPTAAAITLSAGLALAHFDLEVVGGTVRLRAPLEPDLSADEILSEMRFDHSACEEGELSKRREDMRELLTPRRRALFSNNRLGRCTAGEFDVELKPEFASGERQIPNMPPRPLPPEKQRAVDEEFERMLRNGVVMPEPTNAYGAALVVVPKPKGGWRIAMDFRCINSATVKQFYSPPRVLDCV